MMQPISQSGYKDTVNFIEYLYILIRAKWIIAISIIAGVVLGYGVAIQHGGRYTCDAVIAPSAKDAPTTPNLSGFGMFGAMAATQLSLGGTASLDKVEQTFQSRTFRGKLITEYGFLPYLLPKLWDTTAHAWKDTNNNKLNAIKLSGLLMNVVKTDIKGSVMTISATHTDSIPADSILRSTLIYLDKYLRHATITQANENRRYLEEQLDLTTDPILRAKLQEMIASEVEKTMMVSKEAFVIVDDPMTSYDFKQKTLYPVAAGATFGLISIFIAILFHALTGSNKRTSTIDTDYSKKLFKEFFRLPFFKR